MAQLPSSARVLSTLTHGTAPCTSAVVLTPFLGGCVPGRGVPGAAPNKPWLRVSDGLLGDSTPRMLPQGVAGGLGAARVTPGTSPLGPVPSLVPLCSLSLPWITALRTSVCVQPCVSSCWTPAVAPTVVYTNLCQTLFHSVPKQLEGSRNLSTQPQALRVGSAPCQGGNPFTVRRWGPLLAEGLASSCKSLRDCGPMASQGS